MQCSWPSKYYNPCSHMASTEAARGITGCSTWHLHRLVDAYKSSSPAASLARRGCSGSNRDYQATPFRYWTSRKRRFEVPILGLTWGLALRLHHTTVVAGSEWYGLPYRLDNLSSRWGKWKRAVQLARCISYSANRKPILQWFLRGGITTTNLGAWPTD